MQDRRSSILLAVDVSGSMQQPAPGTSTPLIELVRQGCLAVGQMLPDQSSLGLWAFGSQLDPPRDYRVLLPTAPLTDGQRAGLAGAVGQLAAAADRDRAVRHDPGRVQVGDRARTGQDEANQVVIFTDGRNEDDPVSITAAQLAAGLKAAADPKRPVELTVVAYGQLPEVAGLRERARRGGRVRLQRCRRPARSRPRSCTPPPGGCTADRPGSAARCVRSRG